MRRIELPARDHDCPACGHRQFPYLDGDRRSPISLCGRNAVQIHERRGALDLEDLKRRLLPLGEVRANEFGLRFFCPPYEMTIFRDGRAIVKGTTDTGLARSLETRSASIPAASIVEAARSEANTSLRLKPSPEAYLVLARLDLRENKPESASECVSKALELAPNNASVLAVQRMVAARTQPSH